MSSHSGEKGETVISDASAVSAAVANIDGGDRLTRFWKRISPYSWFSKTTAKKRNRATMMSTESKEKETASRDHDVEEVDDDLLASRALPVLRKRRAVNAECSLRVARYDGLDEFMAQGVFTCKVVRVYDGDTVWVAIYSGEDEEDGAPRAWRVCCRLLHIDTPEMPRAHANAMSEYHQKAYAARDRLVELVTDCDLSHIDRASAQDASGTRLPSLSDQDMQAVVDKNGAVLVKGLTMKRGRDKYGRYLATLKTRDGRDVSEVMLAEGHATPYEGGARQTQSAQDADTASV